MIRNDDGLMTGYVYVDLADRDPETFVEEADALLRQKVELPPGYAISWNGQYEAMERVKEKLEVVLPVTIVLILLLLYLNTRSAVKTMIGGIFTSFLLELLVYPGVYEIWKWNFVLKRNRAQMEGAPGAVGAAGE